MECHKPVWCREHCAALLSQLSCPKGVCSFTWRGQVLFQSHVGALPTQGEEQDTATEPAGSVLSFSPLLPFLLLRNSGVHRETGRWGSSLQRSHHPHFPSQPPWVARGGGDCPQTLCLHEVPWCCCPWQWAGLMQPKAPGGQVLVVPVSLSQPWAPI